MDDWEHLAFRLAQLRVYFWAARQVLLLLIVAVVAIVFSAEVVLGGDTSAVDRLLSFLGR